MYAFIDTSKLTALNESITGSCVNPFKPYSKVRMITCTRCYITEAHQLRMSGSNYTLTSERAVSAACCLQRLDPEPMLESNEDDPDLIIFVPFTRVVKLKSICIVGGHGGEGTSPGKIKL